jgi:hypothetical protein
VAPRNDSEFCSVVLAQADALGAHPNSTWVARRPFVHNREIGQSLKIGFG